MSRRGLTISGAAPPSGGASACRDYRYRGVVQCVHQGPAIDEMGSGDLTYLACLGYLLAVWVCICDDGRVFFRR